jgi:hypothetical protein
MPAQSSQERRTHPNWQISHLQCHPDILLPSLAPAPWPCGTRVGRWRHFIFEARDCIGELWAFSDDAKVTTVLEITLGDASQYRNCYGLYPVEGEDDTGTYQGQKGLLEYLER